MEANHLDRLARGAPLWKPLRPAVDLLGPAGPRRSGRSHLAPIAYSASLFVGRDPPTERPATALLALLQEAARMLERAEVVHPLWTAEQLLAHRLGCQPIELRLEPPPISKEQKVRFLADVAARANGVPLQYLMGSASFYGREFTVGPGVFIPRPETEVLIEAALELLSVRPEQAVHPSTKLRMNGASKDKPLPLIVDVGTGSGAIAVTLKLERPGLKVFGVDSSESALSFAAKNAAHHQADVGFLHGNLLDLFEPKSADLIVTNLPYIDPATADQWPRELHWEPWLALNGGEKGLALIRELIVQASSVLRAGGHLLLEVGQEQVAEIRPFAARSGFQFKRLVHDLAGLERVVVLSRQDS